MERAADELRRLQQGAGANQPFECLQIAAQVTVAAQREDV